MTKFGNPLKTALRTKMKQEVLCRIPPDSRKQQSESITKLVLTSEAFEKAERISVYLSTPHEVDTTYLLREMFARGKQVFVPVYGKKVTEMLRLRDMCDYESLPMTKQNIKQPSIDDNRENALATGGIDMFLVPGVAFTLRGGRMGHGMGFYDKYFARHSELYPEKHSEDKLQKTILMALAFKEQILTDEQLPFEPHDVQLDYVVTEDGVFASK